MATTTTQVYPATGTVFTLSSPSYTSSTSEGVSTGALTTTTYDTHQPTATVSSSFTPSHTSSSSDGASTSTLATTTHATQPTPTTSASPTPSHTRNSSNGVSKGALAGAIVGSIVGTAILAFLAAWLFLRRSQKSKRGGFHQRHGGEHQSTAVLSKEADQSNRFLSKISNSNDSSFGASENLLLSSGRRLSKYVPEAADDESVLGRVLRVFDQVGLHVDNFYSHSQPVVSPAETARISDFDTPYLPGPLFAYLENPKTRRTAITHVLARSLLLAIQPQAATRRSLLPPLFTPGPVRSDGNDLELSQATHAWRLLTAYLSRHATPEVIKKTQASQEAAVNAFVENFTVSFAPYADPALSSEDRARHLRSVTTAAADLGRWLFGQPCAFDFVYTKPEAAAGSNGEVVVVLPAIVKVLDERGQPLATRATLCQAVTAKL